MVENERENSVIEKPYLMKKTVKEQPLQDLECAKIIENYALSFMFCVIAIECISRASGDEF